MSTSFFDLVGGCDGGFERETRANGVTRKMLGPGVYKGDKE